MANAMTRATEARPDRWETVAPHEAGHAVMRWLCGLPATALVAHADGGGLSAGTGRREPVADLLAVTLAGPAVEACYGMWGLDWTRTHFEDFDHARALLAHAEWLRYQIHDGEAGLVDVETALRAHFDEVCTRLSPYSALVDELAEVLTWPVRRAVIRSGADPGDRLPVGAPGGGPLPRVRQAAGARGGGVMATHDYQGGANSRMQRRKGKLGEAITIERLEALLGKRPPLPEGQRDPQGLRRTNRKGNKRGFRLEPPQ
jgi:hypothetical protein